MLNTVVCKKEGCKGNRFKINVQRLKVLMICTECKTVEKLNREMNSIFPTICSKCTGEIFKVCRNNEDNNMYFECTNCGHKFIYFP